MNNWEVNSVYFIGIGGIGMSALALYMNAFDISVYGYDKVPSEITQKLSSLGVEINHKDEVDQIPSDFLSISTSQTRIIYTPAIPSNHRQLQFFKERGYEILKRSEALAEVISEMRTIAIAGTHGKTTTSSLLAHILDENMGCNAFLGGISNNIGSNFLLNKESDLVVVEADEYDRSFLRLNPFCSVITTLDPDHLDIYESENAFNEAFETFANKTAKDGFVCMHQSVSQTIQFDGEKSIYGGAKSNVENLRIEDNQFVFDMILNNERIKDIVFHLPGKHNALNALAASIVAKKMGVPLPQIINSLRSFKGIKRRFEYIIQTPQCLFIDDYAHHPGELNATISAVKNLYPNKNILGVFQPHLFSRTKDFMAEFATSLAQLDQLILLDIYPARELPIDGVSSQTLLEQVQMQAKQLLTKEELLKGICDYNFDILLTLGAGDIDRLISPLREKLMSVSTIKSEL